ncbi:TrbG/VirB9 family P-type conjugative transfer protein [Aurantiacibacter sp. D1-12]|uniref:TrbG/VirB9 family P-type conjugative transfer protein n=1 Tax=Aurantiacibacter sp. D1-12 TaxID=2993658 RepID=UPI00237D072A|nr:TrbG/VirB9 family P-type conjugative transfer protein [Aurantiacibacter sp. D1-12]MDE1466116.1 TrbG/VirB9 family P-type conjugative transfer protein [Aurantiacibacter sp. D1-12]
MLALLLAGLAWTNPATAQVVPDLELGNPRLQTVQWEEGMDVLLTIFPGNGMTVMLEAGETIERVTISNEFDFEVRVSPEGNSLLVLADREAAAARMTVETNRRTYPFTLRVGEGLTAAYLVRFTYNLQSEQAIAEELPEVPLGNWSYRLRGDGEVRPQSIRDDGIRTYISYAPDQALPAVFAIGQTGEEEMVNGHMRGGLFVIDRVYSELVFRLDDERAHARRNSQPDGEG